MNVYDQAHGLAQAIKASQEFIQYDALKKQVDAFRLRNYHLQEADVDLYEAVDEVDREFRELQKIPVVAEYLDAELSVCKMIQKVLTIISDEVQIAEPEL